MTDVNPFYVVLFGIAWLALEHIVKWCWRTYKEHSHQMQEIKLEKRQDRHGHS